MPSWTIENIIKVSMNVIKTFEDSYISHNYREFNCVADYFSNRGVRLDTRKTWFREDTLEI